MAGFVTVDVDGARETASALRRLPAAADRSLREATAELAAAMAGRITTGARADSAQSALMVRTVRVRPGREPSIVAGGSTPVGRNQVPADKILFGSMFGARTLPQFRPWLGTRSYWFFRTVYRNEQLVGRHAEQGADRVVDAFDRGP